MSSTLWRDPDFIKLWVGQTVSEVGSHITGTGLPLTALLLLHASPEQMGLLTALVSLPVLLFGLFAGVWVDRLRRRPLMIAADLGRFIILLAVPVAAFTGRLSFELLCIVAMLTGILSLLFNTAYHAALPSLVERQRLLEANTKLAMTSSAAEVGGPPLAGVLIQLMSAPLAMCFDALSFLVSALSLWLIRKPEAAPLPQSEGQSVFAEIGEGLRVLRDQPILRPLVVVAILHSFFGNFYGVLYSYFVIQELGFSPTTLGVLIGAGGAGALVGAFVAGKLRRYRLGTVLIVTLFLPLTFTPFWLLNTGIVAAVALFANQLIGDSFGAIYGIYERSLQQMLIPDHLLGRVNASVSFLSQGMLPFGALVGGALGGLIGARATLAIATCGFLVAAVYLMLSPVRQLDEVESVPSL